MIRSVEPKPPATEPENPSQLLDSIADMIRSVEKPQAPPAVPVDPSQLLDSIADMIRSVEKTPAPTAELEDPSQILDSIADMIRSIEKEPPVAKELVQSPVKVVNAIALAPTPEQELQKSSVPKSTSTITDQEMTNDNIVITQSDNSSKQQPIYKHGYNIIDNEVKETQYIPIPVN